MTYEVIHGNRTEFIQAGNPWSACLDVLRMEAEDNDIQRVPFDVTPLPLGDTETIDMALVLGIQNQAVNGEPITTRQPTQDLTHW